MLWVWKLANNQQFAYNIATSIYCRYLNPPAVSSWTQQPHPQSPMPWQLSHMQTSVGDDTLHFLGEGVDSGGVGLVSFIAV